MTKFKAFAAFILISTFSLNAQLIDIPSLHEENQTFTYEELIGYYEELAEASDRCILIEIGQSDMGLPIHALVATNEELSLENFEHVKSMKYVMAINNGIHPGESCGVDASLHFINEYLSQEVMPGSNEMIVIVPMYNVGGAHNRGCCTRANQDGPISQGFRGNARNYDLNRDLIKADARNTYALYRLFDLFEPEIFIDTHSTNGADYPYEMTLITSPWQKYPEPMQEVVRRTEAMMFERMDERGVLMSPYVNVFGRTPNSGFSLFPEGAMYTTGYAALHGSVAFVTEAHMLKPYIIRVHATKVFLEEALYVLNQGGLGNDIGNAYGLSIEEEYDRQVIQWSVDETHADTLNFLAYESGYKKSEITGAQRLYYTDEMEEVRVPYFNQLTPEMTIVVPDFYYIPVGQWEILERFAAVGVEMDTIDVFEANQQPLVQQFQVDSYSFASRPYEGHVMIDELDVSLRRTFLKPGRYAQISTQQAMGRYLQECLHPLAPSSFMRWNFFDSYLQQKEHYSDYVWEDTAAELLENDDELREEFEEKKESDIEFAGNPNQQLYWIYTHSEYYEDSHMNLPYYLTID